MNFEFYHPLGQEHFPDIHCKPNDASHWLYWSHLSLYGNGDGEGILTHSSAILKEIILL